MDLEAAFHKEMLDIYFRVTEECSLVSRLFLKRFHIIVSEMGGLIAAKQFLASGESSEWLIYLCEDKRLDLSMEAKVLRDPWRKLFTEEELEIAQRRLIELGYTPK